MFGHERLHISFPSINLPGENNVIAVDEGVHWEDVDDEEEKDASTIPSNETSFEELVDKCFDYLQLDVVERNRCIYSAPPVGTCRGFFVPSSSIKTIIKSKF